MSIVIDASVALKWVLDEPDSPAAFALRQEDLMAPALWLAEAANTLWRRTRIGDLTVRQADMRLSELLKAPVISFAVEPLLPRAFTLATELGHPVYDCTYLALALHHNVHVVTADRRFAAAASRLGMTDRVRPLVP